MQSIYSCFCRQRNFLDQYICKLLNFFRYVEFRDVIQLLKPLLCGIRVASSGLLENQGGYVQLELVPVFPPLFSYFLICRHN